MVMKRNGNDWLYNFLIHLRYSIQIQPKE